MSPAKTPEFLQPVIMQLSTPRRRLQARLLVLLIFGWWLMTPMSALLAKLFSLMVSRTDAVILASFIGPIVCLALIIQALWRQRQPLWPLVLVLLVGLLQRFGEGLL